MTLHLIEEDKHQAYITHENDWSSLTLHDDDWSYQELSDSCDPLVNFSLLSIHRLYLYSTEVNWYKERRLKYYYKICFTENGREQCFHLFYINRDDIESFHSDVHLRYDPDKPLYVALMRYKDLPLLGRTSPVLDHPWVFAPYDVIGCTYKGVLCALQEDYHDLCREAAVMGVDDHTPYVENEIVNIVLRLQMLTEEKKMLLAFVDAEYRW